MYLDLYSELYYHVLLPSCMLNLLHMQPFYKLDSPLRFRVIKTVKTRQNNFYLYCLMQHVSTLQGHHKVIKLYKCSCV
jgi:hypothetical protein